MEPGPYDEIDPKWFWSRHKEFVKSFARNPKKENLKRDVFQKTILRFEERLENRISNIINDFSGEEFINKMKNINELAWKESEELIV